MDAAFRDWQRQLMDEMRRLADSNKSRGLGGCFADAVIPYRWGWSPRRAARAYLHLDHHDFGALHDAAMRGGDNAQTRRESGASETGQVQSG